MKNKINIMKKSNLSIVILILSVVFYSCSNTNRAREDSLRQTDATIIDNFFEKIEAPLSNKLTELRASSKSEDDLAITFLVIKDNQSGNIRFANFKTKRIFPLPGHLFSSKKKYTVICTGGSEGDWTATCGGKFSCGTKIIECLDEGGCASICRTPENINLNEKDFLGTNITENGNFNLKNITAVKIGFTN